MAGHFDEVWDNQGCDNMCDTCKNAAGGESFLCPPFETVWEGGGHFQISTWRVIG